MENFVTIGVMFDVDLNIIKIRDCIYDFNY